jgi:multimeric flavodoxin WrbA
MPPLASGRPRRTGPAEGGRPVPTVLGIECSLRNRREHSLFEPLSGVMLQGVLDVVREISDFRTDTLRLGELTIFPCRGCFSDVETRCHFLCDCYEDDFRRAATAVMEADVVLFSTPTYLFGMSSVLKRFLERWVSLKAPRVDAARSTKNLDECFEILQGIEDDRIVVRNPLQGKVGAVLVAGSELGQDSVIRELLLILNLHGFVIPPQGFLYHTGHSMQSMEDVRESFYRNTWLLEATRNLGHSLVQMARLTRGAEWPEMPALLPQG